MRPKVRRFVVMKGDPGPPGIKGKHIDGTKTSNNILFDKGDRGDSIVGSKGDRGAPGLPGR